MKVRSLNRAQITRIFVFAFLALGFLVCLSSDALVLAQQPEVVDSACYEIWSAVINVQDNGAVNKDLIYGQGIHATINQDVCDTLAPPPPPSGSFDARFAVSSPPPPDLFVDYRDADQAGVIEWRIKFQPGPGGYPFTFTWDPAALPGAGTIRLQDVFGGAIGVDVDMRGQSNYELQNTDISELEIVYSTDRCTITAVASGDWTSDATWDENCQAGTPSSTDDVYIPDTVSVNYDPASTTVESLTAGGSGGMMVFTNDGTLTVSDNAFTRDNALIDLGSSGTLVVNGELTNEGRLSQTRFLSDTLSPEAAASFLNIAGYGGLTVNSNGTDLGHTTVTIKGGLPCDTDDTAAHRCFYITPTNNSTVASLTYYYGSGELNGSTCSTMQAWRSTGGNTWTEAGTVGTRSCGSSPYSVDYTGVTLNNTGTIFALRSTSAPTAITLHSLSTGNNSFPLLLAAGLLIVLFASGVLIFLRRNFSKKRV